MRCTGQLYGGTTGTDAKAQICKYVVKILAKCMFGTGREQKKEPTRNNIWSRRPKSLEEVDNGRNYGHAAKLREHDPGYLDCTYNNRRTMYVESAKKHNIGEPIPSVQYTDEEKFTWKKAFLSLKDLYPLYACKEFNEGFSKCNFSEDSVPQLEDVSQLIRSQTGWQIRPIAGKMHPRDFLNGFAFNTFHAAQHLRHHSNPFYAVDPDLVHEMLGHAPMLTNRLYCELLEKIGQASLVASDTEFWELLKVYACSVEFGLLQEASDTKVLGAGILSSYGEFKSFINGHTKTDWFDPVKQLPKATYDDGFQSTCFLFHRFEDISRLLFQYSALKE